MNKVFKDIVGFRTSIYRFVTQYEKVVESRYVLEEEEDHRSFYSPPKLWSDYPIEQHAREVYTRTMFRAFKGLLKRSTGFASKEVAPLEKFVVSEAKTINGSRGVSFVVTVNMSESKFSCECKLWESEGMLCAHSLKVLTDLNFRQIPSYYILLRWKKDMRHMQYPGCEKGPDQTPTTKATRFNSLCKIAVQLANEGCSYEKTFIYAKDEIVKIIDTILSMKQKIPEKDNATMLRDVPSLQQSQDMFSSNTDRVKDPKSANCKGQRKVQRFINPLEKNSKKPRICRRCHGSGHNRRTCTVEVHDMNEISAQRDDDYEETI